MRTLLAIAVLLGFASDAQACFRCGNYRSCRYVPKAYVPPPPLQQVQSNVYVIQNAGTPTPLVAQGASLGVSNGGYQQGAYPYFDRNAFMHGQQQLLLAFNSVGAASMARVDAQAVRFAELDAPIAQQYAVGQSAAMVLNAAGLTPGYQAQGQSSAVVVTHSANGVQVTPLNQQQLQAINGQANGYMGGQPYNGQKYQAETAPPPQPYPLLAQFCTRCHDQTEAKGGFVIGDERMQSKYLTISQVLSSGKKVRDETGKVVKVITMPPAKEKQPTQAQKVGILDEVEAIVESGVSVQGSSPPPDPAPAPPQPAQPMGGK